MADGVKIKIHGDDSGFKSTMDKLGGVAKGAMGVAIGAVTAVTGALAAGATQVVRLGAEFEQTAAKASTLFGNVAVDTENLNRKMLDLSSATGVVATELNDGLYAALSSGVPVTEDMAEATEFMAGAAKLAKAGFTSVNTAVEATAKTLNAYGMGTSEAGRIQGILIQTQNKGITTVEEIVAESCFDVLSNEKNINKIIEQDKTLAETIKDWLTNFIAKLKEVASQVGKNRAEYRALHNDIEALEKINDTFYSALLGTKKSDTQSDGEAKYMLVGKETDGTEVYETSEETKVLSLNEKKKTLVNKIRHEYRGRTAKFTKNGASYYAILNQSSAKKGVYGDKSSDTKGYKAKINIGADGNYFELAENSRYSNSKDEKGKTTNTNIHKNVKTWDYFVKTIKSDGKYFDVLINVADKGNDKFVYDIALNEKKETTPLSSSQITTLNQEAVVPNTNISQDNNGVNSHSMQKDEKDTNIKYMINEDFNKQYDEWDKKQHITFEVGITSSALQSIGANERKILWDGTKILKILNKHKGMSDSVIKQVPHILEKPIVIVQSLQSDSRITMFGDVLDETGKPVLAVLELTPTDANSLVLDEIKIASAYGKDNAQSLINRSEILYVEPNKKRTNDWLKSIQLQLPSSLTNYGSINRVSYNESPVNSYDMQNDKNNAKFMLPSRDSSENDVQLYRNQQYVNEIKALRKQVEVLKQQFKITKGHKLSEKAIDGFTKRMLNKYKSDYVYDPYVLARIPVETTLLLK